LFILGNRIHDSAQYLFTIRRLGWLRFDGFREPLNWNKTVVSARDIDTPATFRANGAGRKGDFFEGSGWLVLSAYHTKWGSDSAYHRLG
jgi:hypothetical protein